MIVSKFALLAFTFAVVATTGCAAETSVDDDLHLLEEGEGLSSEAKARDPYVAYLNSKGFSVKTGFATLPSGNYDRFVAYPIAVKNGKPILPKGFLGTFRGTSREEAAKWIASVMTPIPGRDRVDLVTFAERGRIRAEKGGVWNLRFADGLVGLPPKDRKERALTNLSFDGGWSDVKKDGADVQAAVVLVGDTSGVLLYAENHL
jgi:hypothetical protein